MSFLTTSTEVKTSTVLAAHISKAQALSLLHNDTAMLDLNPSKITYTLLPPTTAEHFYTTVPEEHKPPIASPGPISSLPVFQVTEHQSAAEEGEAQGGHWKGGWVKRFVPNELAYQTSIQHMPNGMISITHAPMGVQSVTTWVINDPKNPGEGCLLEKTGKVWSNRMLMGFIKGGLQASYERLAADFVVALEKWVVDEAKASADGAGGDEKKLDKESRTGDTAAQVEVENVA